MPSRMCRISSKRIYKYSWTAETQRTQSVLEEVELVIDRETAYQLALATIKPPSFNLRKRGDSLVIVEHATIEKEYGWIFFYNSRKYLETKKERYQLYGGIGVVVEKADGCVHELGSAGGAEYQIELYEARKNNQPLPKPPVVKKRE